MPPARSRLLARNGRLRRKHGPFSQGNASAPIMGFDAAAGRAVWRTNCAAQQSDVFFSHGRTMGIRFLCPNGHKLNVKADLAGKRASCPDCGAKLVDSGLGRAFRAARYQRRRRRRRSCRPHIGGQRRESGAHRRVGRLVRAAGERRAIRPGRPTTLFRTWIAEGRVTADAHVWRDGWAEWKLARDAADVLPIPLAAMPVVAASGGRHSDRCLGSRCRRTSCRCAGCLSAAVPRSWSRGRRRRSGSIAILSSPNFRAARIAVLGQTPTRQKYATHAGDRDARWR